MDTSSRKKISKDTVELNNIINQLDIKNTYGLLHSKTAEYAFFSSSYGSFSWGDHMLGHETHLNIFKKSEMISSISSDHNGMILEINYKKKDGKINEMSF